MKRYDLKAMNPEAVSGAYYRKAVFGDSLSVARVEVSRGEATLPHSHSTEEMIFVLKGCWRFSLPDGDVELREDQLLCIPAGVVHSSEALEDTVALDICSQHRADWMSGQDKPLHENPEQFLWGV